MIGGGDDQVLVAVGLSYLSWSETWSPGFGHRLDDQTRPNALAARSSTAATVTAGGSVLATNSVMTMLPLRTAMAAVPLPALALAWSPSPLTGCALGRRLLNSAWLSSRWNTLIRRPAGSCWMKMQETSPGRAAPASGLPSVTRSPVAVLISVGVSRRQAAGSGPAAGRVGRAVNGIESARETARVSWIGVGPSTPMVPGTVRAGLGGPPSATRRPLQNSVLGCGRLLPGLALDVELSDLGLPSAW